MNRGKRLPPRELPLDVVVEILLRLPAEHVLQCKLLSKTYYQLITNPDFINNHLLLHQNSRNTKTAMMIKIPNNEHHVLKIMWPRRNSCFVTYKPPGQNPLHGPDGHDKEIVGSCNGLLCVLSKNGDLPHTLWNPITREIFKIRNPKLDRHVDYSSHGFGYDARCGLGDYKLVKILQYYCPPSKCLMVWSLSTNQWKEIGEVLPDRVTDKHRIGPLGLLIRNNLYWLVRPWTKDCSEYILLSFNMSTDTFKEVTMPEDFVHSGYWEGFNPTLNNFMGSLAIFTPLSASSSNDDVPPYGVWVMDNDDDSWTKKLSIVRLFSKWDPWLYPELLYPTQVSINGNFVMRRDVNGTTRIVEFHFYDPRGKNQEGKELRAYYKAGSNTTLWCFTGSLVSINKHHLSYQQSTRMRNRQGQQLVSGPKQK